MESTFYSSDIHARICRVIAELKENQTEEKFQELVELFKEKYGPEKYRNAIASYFFEPAIFVKVSDAYREKHADKYDDDGCDLFIEALEKSDSDSDQEGSEEQVNEDMPERLDDDNDDKDDHDENEEEKCDACVSDSSKSDGEADAEDNDEKPMTEEEFVEYMKSLGADYNDKDDEDNEDDEDEDDEDEDNEDDNNDEGDDEDDEDDEDDDEDDEGDDEDDEGDDGDDEGDDGDDEVRKERRLEYESNIEDIVPIQNVSFLMMMFFSLDRNEKKEFSKEITQNKEKHYYLQPNPFYLNHEGSEYHSFIQNCVQKYIGGDGSDGESAEDDCRLVEEVKEVEKVEKVSTEVISARSPSPFDTVSDCVIR